MHEEKVAQMDAALGMTGVVANRLIPGHIHDIEPLSRWVEIRETVRVETTVARWR